MHDSATRQLPRAVIALAVLATGAATIWAVMKAGPLGPYTSWERAQSAVEQIWTGQPPGMQPQAMLPPQAAPPQPAAAAPPPPQPGTAPSAMPNSAARTVGLPGVPTILSGATRPHPDRGACTSCHTVTDGGGRTVPAIQSFAMRPHEYRGVCSNCHQVTVASAGNPVAATLPMPNTNTGSQLALQGAVAPPAAPTEAEWRGLEVQPASQGVVITGVGATAGQAGVQPGDVVESINGLPVRDMFGFNQVTQNGRLGNGTMICRRNGQRLAFELSGTAPAAPPPPTWSGPGMNGPGLHAPGSGMGRYASPQMGAPTMP